jgi:hypothetical protein
MIYFFNRTVNNNNDIMIIINRIEKSIMQEKPPINCLWLLFNIQCLNQLVEGIADCNNPHDRWE